MRETVLTIAGSDSSGGAGIQADLNTISANGGYGATAITAITAQNTRGVMLAQALPAPMVRAQIEAVFSDAIVAAVKTGMLGSVENIRAVADALRTHSPRHFVLDPVMTSTTGYPLLPSGSADVLRDELLPIASLVTPNVPEASILSGLPVDRVQDAEAAGRRILERGAKAVLVKGGHLTDSPATDLLVTQEGCLRFDGTWIHSEHTHGTGCVLSAAIATHLALGLPIVEAVGKAKEFVTEAIRKGLPRGYRTEGRNPGTLHVITDETLQERFTHVDLARLAAEGGADVVQFREKRPRTTADLVRTARQMARALTGSGVRLVVNDRVDVALGAGADAVHLGRDDLAPRLARKLMGESALIGGTANNLEQALRVATGVDYLGVGPVFGTRTKTNPATAIGIEGLRAIAEAVGKPLIAVGSITPERVADVLSAGAHGVAVASAVVTEHDPAKAARSFRDAIEACRRKRKTWA